MKIAQIIVEDAYDNRTFDTARLYWNGGRIQRITAWFRNGRWHYSLKMLNGEAIECNGTDLLDVEVGE